MRIKYELDTGFKAQDPSGLLSKVPQVITVNDFKESTAKAFIDELYEAAATGQPVIPIIIDSYGGNVHSVLVMLDAIAEIDIPVATICVGKAMSGGSALLAGGTPGYRYSSPNGRIMIHDVYDGGRGKVEDIKADSAESDRLKTLYFGRMATCCGQPKKYFINQLNDRNNADWYLSPKEALDHKVIDHIGIPHLVLRAQISYGFK